VVLSKGGVSPLRSASHMPRFLTPDARNSATPERLERRRQIRGLLFLALAAILFAILRAGVHRVFTTGWWRLW
jgi:hypothetical protein